MHHINKTKQTAASGAWLTSDLTNREGEGLVRSGGGLQPKTSRRFRPLASWRHCNPKTSRILGSACLFVATVVFAIFITGCAAYGPYHANTSGEPFNSVRGPKDGRYKLALIEFGDQGSMLDPSQLAAALQVIDKADRPLLFVYIHGWQNNAVSGDVCRFEHFIDTMSGFPEMTGRKINVIGVYIAWRGKDLTVPGLNLLTFWSRKVCRSNSSLAKQLFSRHQRAGIDCSSAR